MDVCQYCAAEVYIYYTNTIQYTLHSTYSTLTVWMYASPWQPPPTELDFNISISEVFDKTNEWARTEYSHI